MTIKHKSNMSFDPVYLAKLESGKEPLPVGINKTSSGYGYRISRTFKGTEYRFGTFQSLEHALRTNEYLNRFLDAVNDELEKRPATVEDLGDALNKLDTINTGKFQELAHAIMTIRIKIDILEEELSTNKSFFQRLFNL